MQDLQLIPQLSVFSLTTEKFQPALAGSLGEWSVRATFPNVKMPRRPLPRRQLEDQSGIRTRSSKVGVASNSSWTLVSWPKTEYIGGDT